MKQKQLVSGAIICFAGAIYCAYKAKRTYDKLNDKAYTFENLVQSGNSLDEKTIIINQEFPIYWSLIDLPNSLGGKLVHLANYGKTYPLYWTRAYTETEYSDSPLILKGNYPNLAAATKDYVKSEILRLNVYLAGLGLSTGLIIGFWCLP